MKINLSRTTAVELQHLLSKGELTSAKLVRQCHQQRLAHNGRLRAIISMSPLSYTEKIASKLDMERREGSLRGPLHGIPLIVKVFLSRFKGHMQMLNRLTGRIQHDRRI